MKKEYLQPSMEIMEVETEQLMEFSEVPVDGAKDVEDENQILVREIFKSFE